jgi:hypothetical protein
MQKGVIEVHNKNHPSQFKLAAIKKDGNGDITEFRTNTGETFSYSEAVEYAKQGKIAGVEVYNKNGKEALRSEDDGIEGNQLEHLPDYNHLTDHQ